MGSYIYKTTKNTVELSNGEQANVAIFAYKPFWETADKQHVTSGAAACDRAARDGKRLDWVVTGRKRDDGRIEVEIEGTAKKIGARGHINDDWFAETPLYETSAVAATLDPKIVLVRNRHETLGKHERGSFGVYIKEVYDRMTGWTEVQRSEWRSFG